VDERGHSVLYFIINSSVTMTSP